MNFCKSIVILIFASLYIPLFSFSPQQEYNEAVLAFRSKNWEGLKHCAKKIIDTSPHSPFLPDLYFYMGVALFHQGDYDHANQYFSDFLKYYASPKHFEEVFLYKFQIAEKFQRGAKKHLMGLSSLPRWVPAWEEAYPIYDEVITSLPRHELAAKALFNKGEMLWEEGRYGEAIEIYESLIRRFSKSPLAPKSYVVIAKIYFDQSKQSFPDPNFLDQAKLNRKRFKRDFPGDAKVEEVEKIFQSMQNFYAEDLWESAKYFDKKKKPASSIIYYTSIVKKYPDTPYASLALQRIFQLKGDKLEQDVFIKKEL